jgi:hypothetical protein
MQSKVSKENLFRVEILLISRGYDVISLDKGETGVQYHVRVHTLRGVLKEVSVKSEAIPGIGQPEPLVTFASTTPNEWSCSMKCKYSSPGLAQHPVTVDPNISGASVLRTVELTLTDPLGTSKELIHVNLPIKIE